MLRALIAGLLVLSVTAPAQAAAPACDRACVTALVSQYVEPRLRRLEDEAAIENLLLEYGRTLDARDFAAYAALFAPDGEWKGALGTFKGPKDIQAAMERIFAGAATDIPKGTNFHVMSNFDVRVQGDHATARSHFVFYKMEGNKPIAEVAGRYEDTLIRVGDAWKFQQRNALPPGDVAAPASR